MTIDMLDYQRFSNKNNTLKKEQGDFDIDCVLDKEKQINIMPERIWESIGRSAMIPSIGGISLFRGKLVNLSGRLT